LLNRRTCRTVLRGSMPNQAGLKNMCKKTRETFTGKSSKGAGWIFSVSPHHHECFEIYCHGCQI
jgi:hypothetical protein